MMDPILNSGPVQVPLDANGYGLVRVQATGTTWQLEGITMRCTTAVAEAQGFVYVGSAPDATYLRCTTDAASTGDTAVGSGLTVPDGTAVFFEWRGGDPNGTAIVTYWGTQSVSGGFRARVN